jgi:hypothetical protein
MRRSQKIGECVYCGRVRPLTRDDVPPKNLFPEPRPSNLITVPSCRECNQSFMLDDEYFRLVIADASNPKVSPENFDHLLKAKQKLLGPKKFRSAKGLLLNRMDRSNGLLAVDRHRVERVLERIVRGLFFRLRGMRLPDTYTVGLWSDWFAQEIEDGSSFKSTLKEVERSLSFQLPTRIGRDVFEFRSLTFDCDLYTTAWHLLFYSHRSFIGITALAKA